MAYEMVADKHQKKLQSIKDDIECAFIYWKENQKRFSHFQQFVFKSALSPADRASLNTTQKPIIEFNITNAPISKQCGEFAKQEPSIYVSSENGANVDPEVIEVVEGHLRHILFESKKHNTQYNVHRDQLSGGFSNFKVWTDYANEMSFDQVINFGRTYDPIMTGFDPMAREIDKSDAEYCFEVFPMYKEDFKRKYPGVPLEDLLFVKQAAGFNWSYKIQQREVIVLVDYYKKKKKKMKIYRLADGSVKTQEDYDEFMQEWNAQGFIEQPPAIVDERTSERCYIVRYRIMENQVLEYKDTSFKYIPLVFVDGDSVIIQDNDDANMKQFTKPYVYHAEGIQRLTNFAGQVIANDFENMVMHKFIIAEEALPSQEEALNAYSNVQQASTLIYKSYNDLMPEQALSPPIPVERIPLPQEVLATFNNSMMMLQNIMGSYDASMATSNRQISENTFLESASLSNSSVMPYIVNYMQSLNQVANIIVDLIPKYYVTPRTIPIVDKEGKRSFRKINQPGGLSFNYDENALQVKVEAGVSFSTAKNQAMNQLTLLMKISPEFAEFMTDVGLETLLDNLEFRNVDILKGKIKQWKQMKEMKKQQQPDPEMMKAQAAMQQQQAQMQLAEKQMELKAEEVSSKALLETEKLIVEKEKVDNERLKIMQQAGESKDKLVSSIRKSEAEEERARADMHLKAHDQGHRQFKELADVAIKHHTATKPESKKES